MAISAKFQADFSDFQSAVAKAEVSLKTFETGAGKVGTSLNKMANSLSGNTIIQQATVMAEAVERVGGVSTLTEKELAKVSATATEAANKLRALGQDVPPGIQKIADAAKGATTQFGNWKGALTSVAGAFGVAFSVGAVVNFGKAVFDAGGQINDLASQLGISTDAVQGFKFAAEQSGSSLDTVGGAITKMNDKLAGGDKATVKALRDVGKEFSDIRNMRPEDAFLELTDAIQGVADPMKQTELAMALFGKSGAELLPAIKEGFRGVSEGADKMSADTIKALEDAGDAWGRLADRVTIISGTLIATAMNTSARVTSSWANFAMFAENAIKMGVPAALALASAQDKAAQAAEKFGDKNLPLPTAISKTADEIARAEAAAKKYADALNAMFGKFSGATAQAEMDMLDVVFRKMAASGKITEKQIDAIVKEALKLQAEGAKLTERLFDMVRVTDALSPGLNRTALDFSKIGQHIDIVIPKIDKVWDQLNKPVPYGISHLKDEFAALVVRSPADMLKDVQVKTIDLDKALGELAQAFAQMAQIAGGSLGDVIRSFGTVISAIDTAKKAATSFQSGLKGFQSGDLLGGILNMTTGIMGMASAAIAAGKAIAGLFDRNKGRDLVVDFAETFGGFDQLHAELLELGDEGERLWIALTQGVGRNNPKEAQKAIDAITAALAKQSAAREDSTVATEEEAQATIETAAAAAKALDDVSERLRANNSEWSEWSEDVTGYLQKLADTIRAMPIPSPTGSTSPSTYTGGRPSPLVVPRREPATVGGGSVPVVIHNSMVVDGRVLATSVANTRAKLRMT